MTFLSTNNLNSVGILPSLLIFFSGIGPIGPLVQLIIRVLYLKGSLDKPWLFLLNMIPFVSAYPAYQFYAGNVKPGQGGEVYGRNMLIPIFVIGIIYITGYLGLNDRMLDSFIYSETGRNIFGPIIKYMIIFVSFLIAYTIRNWNKCDKVKDASILDKAKIVIGDSLFATTTTVIFYAISKFGIEIFLRIIPGIGKIIGEILVSTPFDLIWTTLLLVFVITCTYTFTNMLSGTNIIEYCKGKNKKDTFYAMIIYIIIYVIHSVIKASVFENDFTTL